MRSWSSAALAAVIAFGALVAAPAAPARAATLDSLESDLVAMINTFRADKGLGRLVVSDTLTAAAKWMATDMAVKNYFSHTSSDGRTPRERMGDAGYPAVSTYTGEDIAAGYDTARKVLDGWIASPAHYAVLTNANYKALGVGRAYGSGSRYGWYWTADFGGVIEGGSTTTTTTSTSTVRVSFDTGFHSAWAGQSADPVLAPGQTATLVVALRNTGYRGWYRGVAGQEARLGTNRPTDVTRYDLASGWLYPSRPASTTTAYVAPGQIGWFSFTVRAPSAPGNYRLDLRGVIDGVTWLEDQGIYFNIYVR